TLLTLPIVGRITDKYNPKYVLFFGIFSCALATYMMSKFTLQADFFSILIPRMVLGLGMGALFIPLTNLTLSYIPKPLMGDATAIYNFLRNLGGSFGIAFATTMMTRRSQFHHLRLSEHMTPFNEVFRQSVEKIRLFLMGKAGLPPSLAEYAGMKGIYGEMLRQSTMKGFNDAFFLLSIYMFCVLGLVFFLKYRSNGEGPGVAVH
ncbi:MAG: MFS transporter, partial [Deltaproteobacteria bacterium]